MNRFGRKLALATVSLAIASGVVAVVAPEASASTCNVTKYGYAGQMICGTKVLDKDWGSGHKESFVVGTNSAVWHAWPGSGGWKSLGGGVKNLCSINGTYNYRSLAAVGPDNKGYINDFNISSGWGGWGGVGGTGCP